MHKMSVHMQEILNPNDEVYVDIPPMPEKLQLELNETCNHACVFCPFHSRFLAKKPLYGVMSFEHAKRILEKAASVGIGRKELGLFATGEPFLYKELPNVVQYARSLDFPYIYLTTNGVFAEGERLKSVLDSGLNSIRFSVNAGSREKYREIHGSDDFDRVCNNVRAASRYVRENKLKVNLSISLVRTKQTKGDTEELKKLLGEYVDEIIGFDVGYTGEIGEGVTELYSLENEQEKMGKSQKICAVVFNTMYIDSRMNVNLCCASQQSKIPIKSLNEPIDLEKAWLDTKYVNWRAKMLKGDLQGTFCESCKMRTIELDYIDAEKNDERI